MSRINDVSPADRQIELSGKRYLVRGQRVWVYRDNRWRSPYWVQLWGAKRISEVLSEVNANGPS